MIKRSQRNTTSHSRRHMTLWEKMVKKGIKPARILSFGCSEGFELLDLRTSFPDAYIVGVDINDAVLEKAKVRTTEDENIMVMHSGELKPEEKFDLIVSCNVLCNYNALTELPPLPYEQFKTTTNELWERVKADGFMFFTGTNYPLKHEELPNSELILIHGDLGPVNCYQHDEKTGLPRSTGLYICKKHFDTDENDTFESTAEHLFNKPGIVSGKRRINIGLMSVAHGTNIGDFSQVLAAVNLWSVFYKPSWHIQSPELREALVFFNRTKPDGECVRAKNYDADVYVYFLDRDTTKSSPNPADDGGTVYVISNGWFMTKAEGATYQMPFADWLHPFCISMHLHRPEVLDQPGVIDWFNKYGPVGCRDTDTEQLFRAKGITCYYSQCLTTTLEMGLTDTDLSRTKQVFMVDQHKRVCSKDDISLSHLQPEFTKGATPGQILKHMLGLLRQYATSEHLASTRIHAVMPSKAMGATNVTFRSPVGSNSQSWNMRSRFSGLLEGFETPAKKSVLATVMYEKLVQTLDGLFVCGFDREQLRRSWSGEFQPQPLFECDGEFLDLASTEEMPMSWEALRKTHPQAIRVKVGEGFDAFNHNSTMFSLKRRTDPEDPTVCIHTLRTVPTKAFKNHFDLQICFDHQYIQHLGPFLIGMCGNNRDTLFRIFAVTRDVSVEVFQRDVLSSIMPHFPNAVIFQVHSTEKFAIFNTSLSHTNRTVMDRLFLTVLPYNVDIQPNRIIYMDLDLTVAGDITEMTRVCTGQYGVSAVSSKIKGVVKKWLAKSKCTNVGYSSDKGFNAGVLVIDLDKLRNNGFWKKICELFYATKGLNDQILLTIYTKGQYKELPKCFNVFIGQDHKFNYAQGLKNSGCIFHQVGSHKAMYIDSLDKYVSKSDKYEAIHYEVWYSYVSKFELLKDLTSHFIYA